MVPKTEEQKMIKSRSEGERLHQAQRYDYGVQRKFTVKYQVVGQSEKSLFVETYFPVARYGGHIPDKIKLMRQKANEIIGELCRDFVESFRLVDGVVKFSHDLRDE